MFVYSLQVQDLIVKQYTVTQRIPDNDLLACRCISNFYNGFGSPTVSCIRGYTAVLSNLLWMGPIPGTGGDADEVGLEVPCTTERVNPIPEISLTNWVQWNARLRYVNDYILAHVLAHPDVFCGSIFPSCDSAIHYSIQLE